MGKRAILGSSDSSEIEMNMPKRVKPTVNDTHEIQLPDSQLPLSTDTNEIKKRYSGELFTQSKKTDHLGRAVKKYISEHGFGVPTPPLSRKLSADDFLQHYYDTKTLAEFCRTHNIPTQGVKKDLNTRVEHFLRTGKVPHVNAPRKPSGPFDSERGLRLDMQVRNYKSDPVTRAFFSKHIPNFSFSAHVQKWLKERLANGDVFTYADVIAEQKRYAKEMQEAKSSGARVKVTHDSCQLNQFQIDYCNDAQGRKYHPLKDAWALVRDTAGPKTYARYQEKIAEIEKIIQSESQPPTILKQH